MTTVRRVGRGVGIITVALLTLAACGGGGGGSGGGNESAAGDDDIDPIGEFLNFGDFDEEESQRQYADQERRRQELIRACMAREGFDYTPIDPQTFTGPSSWPGEGLSQKEFASQLGYGMSTTFEESFTRGPESDYVDPNQQQIDTMSESQREAWYAALYGPPVEGPGPVPDKAKDGVVTDVTVVSGEGSFGGGCEGEASSEVYGDQGNDDPFGEFEDLWSNYEEFVENDRRMRDAESSWRECMADEGFDFNEPEDALDSVNERMQEIWNSIEPPDLTEEEMGELTPEELDELYRPDPDPELLAEIQDYEVAVATADYACGADIRKARNSLAQDYLDAHRDEFERYRELIEDQQGFG